MSRIHPRALARPALLAASVLLAVSGSASALAASSPAPAHAGQAAAADSYSMQLSAASVTLQPGGTARVLVSFRADADLLGAQVNMSVTGLPAGVTASFNPAVPVVGGIAVMTLTASGSSPAAAATPATVRALTFGIDPIGTTAPLSVTVG